MMDPPVWVPSVVFVNPPDTDVSTTDSKAALFIRKQGQYSMSALDDIEQVECQGRPCLCNCIIQVLYYEGSENPVLYNRKYARDFSCDIKLNRYPFDSQVIM